MISSVTPTLKGAVKINLLPCLTARQGQLTSAQWQRLGDIEIVVMDAERALGNGFVLPAGPLRELPSRLKNVDFVITNGGKNVSKFWSSILMQ